MSSGVPFKCGVCGLQFSTKDNLAGHVSAVHEGQKPHRCSHPDCNFATGYRGSLKKHMEGQHGIKKEKQ